MEPPPLPPPCDLECQKQKQLATLKRSLDSVDPKQDPAGYEKARIAYYTLLKGPGWLAQEKQKIAKQDVEPVLSSYRQQFETLKGEQQTHGIFKNLADGLKAKETADEQDTLFLNKQLMIDRDKTTTANRLSEIGSVSSYAWLSWVVDIVIALLGLFVLYKGYIKFFSQTSPAVPDLSSV